MGVARNEAKEVAPIRVIGEIGDYDLSDSGDEVAFHAHRISVEQLNQIPPKQKPWTPRRPKTFREEVETGGVHVKRNMGSRKWRRVELARNMLNFTELEDICEDFSDVFHQPYSAFDRLFADHQNMKKWNEFIEKDEIEQRKILENGGIDLPNEQQGGSGWAVLGGKTSTPTKKSTPRKSNDESPDKRKHHPAYSGKSCFDRIDSRGKGTLMGRRVNWALIDHLETELRALFSMSTSPLPGDTDTVFVAHYPASSDRFLAHIISQYLWLTSQSVTDPITKDRITEIRNPRAYFIPPHVRLIDFLEENVLKRRIEFIPYSMREENQNDCAISEELDQLNISTNSDDEWVNVNNKNNSS